MLSPEHSRPFQDITDGETGTNPGTGTDPGTNPGTDPGTGTGGSTGVTIPETVPTPTARIARLTHSQWLATVRDLFGLGASTPTWSDTFRADPNQAGFIFGNAAADLVVDQPLETSYERAAEDVAAYLITDGDTSMLSTWLPSSGTETDRVRAFVEAVGARAHRRPITAAEVDAYLAVYQVGAANPEDVSAFTSGLRLVVRALLSSPYFIYRTELSDTIDGTVIPLDDYEIASRLSYFLWNTMPDDALFAAAAAGELTDAATLPTHVSRMLGDARASTVVERFHHALLDMDRYAQIGPSSAVFPEAPANLSELARDETYRVVRDAFEKDQGWKYLLTTDKTFVNADLASLYGLSGTFGSDFQEVTLDGAERNGIFTQIGFLTAHATSTDPDPIHRGVFLTKRIACNQVGAAPANLPSLPAPDGQTNREVVEDLTEVEGTVCASCHTTIINPFGFPFENFDALGRVRSSDNGLPLDTTAEAKIGDGFQMVTDALELTDALADADVVHSCYADHWVQFAFGKATTDGDAGLVARLGKASAEGGSIRTLISELVTSPAFLNRAMEEL